MSTGPHDPAEADTDELEAVGGNAGSGSGDAVEEQAQEESEERGNAPGVPPPPD